MNRRQLIIGGGTSALALTIAGPRLLQAQQATPETSGAQLFELPGDAVYPEGVAYDDATGLFYTGSTGTGTIFQGDLATGEVVILSENEPARPAAVGMTLDGIGHLIVAGGGSGTVSVLDSASGATIATFTGAFEEAFINDAKASPTGDIYVTDSLNPVLYRIAAADIEAGGDLQPFVDFTGTPFQYGEPGSFNANGLVVTEDGAYVIVVNTGTGQLFKVDIATTEVTEITIDGEPVVNGDGLAIAGQILYVLRNQAALIVRLELDGSFSTATEIDAITDPSFAFPTTLALVGTDQALVVNAQFDKRESGNPELPFTVSLITLPPIGIPATPEASPIS